MKFPTLAPEQIEMLQREGYSPLESIDEYNPPMKGIIRLMYSNGEESKTTLRVIIKDFKEGEITSLIGRMKAEDGKKHVNILENSINPYPIGWKLLYRYNGREYIKV